MQEEQAKALVAALDILAEAMRRAADVVEGAVVQPKRLMAIEEESPDTEQAKLLRLAGAFEALRGREVELVYNDLAVKSGFSAIEVRDRLGKMSDKYAAEFAAEKTGGVQ